MPYQPYANQHSNGTDTKLKLVCAGCYLTIGILGVVYSMAEGKGRNSPFFKFHFTQSLIVGIFYILLSTCLSILSGMLSGILNMLGPTVGGIGATIVGYSNLAFSLAYAIACLAGVVQCLRARYLELPFFANLTRRNMR